MLNLPCRGGRPLKDDQFVMVRGYKHAAHRSVLSPAAGMIDEGETPLEAARRELLEETGYAADDWEKLGEFVTDGNRHCGTMHLFYARGAVEVQAPEQDEFELLTRELFSAAQLSDALSRGEIGIMPGATGVAMGLLKFQQSKAS